MHMDARALDVQLKEIVSGLLAHGLKWKNKTYKPKRSIDRLRRPLPAKAK